MAYKTSPFVIQYKIELMVIVNFPGKHMRYP